MLCDVKLRETRDPLMTVLSGMMNKESRIKRLEQGIYECPHFNFECEFRSNQTYELDFPEIGKWEDQTRFSPYGVCDSVDQLKSKLPECVTSGDTKYCISVHHITKKAEQEGGAYGWRWHKWGPYIGIHEPQCEYLSEEPVIEEIYVYHIYQIE